MTKRITIIQQFGPEVHIFCTCERRHQGLWKGKVSQEKVNRSVAELFLNYFYY